MKTSCTMENDRRIAASYCIGAIGRRRQAAADLSIRTGLVRDRQRVIRKPHMTTKGRSGLTT